LHRIKTRYKKIYEENNLCSLVKPVIAVKDVWKTYYIGDNAIHALRGVSLEVPLGEFIAVMGPSGSGKSTMLNMLGSLDIPSKGKVFLDEHDISTLSESDLATIRGKKIGFIFQQFNLIPTLTTKENIMLPMIFQGMLLQDREKRAEELLRKVGLGDRMDNKPTELSGGQQQRVAIARSLANNPEVVLADEPTGNLDSKTGEQIMQLLRDLNKTENKTIIMVTHDEDTAKHADRVAFLKDGLIERMYKPR
tara:strand:+ start:660 stop:1409 length:750 start_codon:yes stop_codon:yes gene_type:complete